MILDLLIIRVNDRPAVFPYYRAKKFPVRYYNILPVGGVGPAAQEYRPPVTGFRFYKIGMTGRGNGKISFWIQMSLSEDWIVP